MNRNDRDASLKEKLKQALTSTFKVISDELNVDYKLDKNKSSKKFDFFEIDNLNSKSDFTRVRAESDSSALKIKFSNEQIYKKVQSTHNYFGKYYHIHSYDSAKARGKI